MPIWHFTVLIVVLGNQLLIHLSANISGKGTEDGVLGSCHPAEWELTGIPDLILARALLLELFGELCK